MTTAQASAMPRGARAIFRDRAFLAAAATLLLAAVGWRAAVLMLGVQLRPEAVAWPDGVQVDAERRNTGFVAGFGDVPPGKFLQSLPTNAMIAAGSPEADCRYVMTANRVLSSHELGSLGMGTEMDRVPISQRKSNWYFVREYFDRVSGSSNPLWGLSMTYYTGGLDTVPHVGENCLQAAGATIDWNQSGDFRVAVPGLAAPWDGELAFRRVVFRSGVFQYAQYYIFSVNGEPANDRNIVRWRLLSPFRKNIYFAKVQMDPKGPIFDIAAADQQAVDFIRAVLPAALKQLPTRQRLAELDRGQG